MRNALVTFAAGLAALAIFPMEATNSNGGTERFASAVVTFQNGDLFPIMGEQKDAGKPIMDPWLSFEQWETDALRLQAIPYSPEQGAQINIVRGTLPSNVGGEAKKKVVDGWIVECTITIDENVTQGILTHEVGHCLGVEHVLGEHSVRSQSIMNPFYEPAYADEVMPMDRGTIERLY